MHNEKRVHLLLPMCITMNTVMIIYVYSSLPKAHNNQELILINKIIQRFDTQSSKNRDISGALVVYNGQQFI